MECGARIAQRNVPDAHRGGEGVRRRESRQKTHQVEDGASLDIVLLGSLVVIELLTPEDEPAAGEGET